MDFIDYLDGLNNNILSQIIISSAGFANIEKSVSVKSYALKNIPQEYNRVLQHVNSNENSYFTLIRFPNLRHNDLKKTVSVRQINSNEKRNYKFSPLQYMELPETFKSVKTTLQLINNIMLHQALTLVTGVDEEVIIHDFDGLEYFSYPLSKRAELYSKFPKIEKKLFGMNFKKFAQWIINKEKDSEAMKRNAIRTKKIIKKLDS